MSLLSRSGGSYRASPEDRRRGSSSYRGGSRYDRDRDRLRTSSGRDRVPDSRDTRARDYNRDRADGRLSSRIGSVNKGREDPETVVLSESDEEYNPAKPQVSLYL